MYTKTSLYKMEESSPILPTANENQDEFHNKDNKEELSVTVISKVAFTTIGALLNQDVETLSNKELENKTTLSLGIESAHAK